MRAVDLLRAVRDGASVPHADIAAFVAGVTAGTVPDYQAAAFLMATCLRGLPYPTTCALTLAMRDSGEQLDLGQVDGPKIDKHSTGGVGDKISLILAPVAAVCGLKVPMISGRGLGHTGGTVDKLQSIGGFSCTLSPDRCQQMLRELGACMAGQSATLAPADRRLYALRDVTATVESVPLITASILAKKLCAGLDALVCDVKVGAGAFMKSPGEALALAQSLVAVGAHAGLPVRVLLSAMDQPLGLAVGNALEVAEAVQVLGGGGPADVRTLSVELVAHMLQLGGLVEDLDDGRARAAAALDDGSALHRFFAIVQAQGGPRPNAAGQLPLPQAARVTDLVAPADGYVGAIDSFGVGQVAVALGAGRAQAADAIDPAVGLVLHRKVGQFVRAGQAWVSVHHRRDDADSWQPALAATLRLVAEPPPPPPLIIGQV